MLAASAPVIAAAGTLAPAAGSTLKAGADSFADLLRGAVKALDPADAAEKPTGTSLTDAAAKLRRLVQRLTSGAPDEIAARDELSAAVDRTLGQLHQAILAGLRDQGIDPEHGFELLLQSRKVSVLGDHPDAAHIDSLLREDATLREGLAALAEAISALRTDPSSPNGEPPLVLRVSDRRIEPLSL